MTHLKSPPKTTTSHPGLRPKHFNWTCPYCAHHTTVSRDHYKGSVLPVTLDNTLGLVAMGIGFIACANRKCRQSVIEATLVKAKEVPGDDILLLYEKAGKVDEWKLRPRGVAREFPAYVPAAILQDYREACCIAELSPKAAATLARRCLQGMIRDFWKVAPKTLFKEISAIEDKVDPECWKAIDALRQIGNIGAHMEADVNVITDVDPEEAALLIRLVETLITEWYVNREERKRRMSALTAAAEAKKRKPSAKPNLKGDESPAVVEPPSNGELTEDTKM